MINWTHLLQPMSSLNELVTSYWVLFAMQGTLTNRRAYSLGVILITNLSVWYKLVPRAFLNRDHDVRAGSWLETALHNHLTIEIQEVNFCSMVVVTKVLYTPAVIVNNLTGVFYCFLFLTVR